jgi:dipeptidyl aminopeptidase/acylaminoacyl peptidase
MNSLYLFRWPASARAVNQYARSTHLTQVRFFGLYQQPDVRSSTLYHNVKHHFWSMQSPAYGKVSAATALSANSHRPLVAFTAEIRSSPDSGTRSRIAISDLVRKTYRVVSEGPGNDCCAKWSPDGHSLAFLSDRRHKGINELFLLRVDDLSEVVATSELPGSAEALFWSPDGRTILIQVAEFGADQAGAQGGARNAIKAEENNAAWLPRIETSEVAKGWRSLWIYDLPSQRLQHVSHQGLNIWEASWLGNDRVLAIASDLPTEDSWYRAYLVTIDLRTGRYDAIYRPELQIGLPVSSPSGSHLAFVECLSSDRGGVAGDVMLMQAGASKPERLDLGGVDVTNLMWHQEDYFSYIGLRGTHTVAGHYYVHTGISEEHWDQALTCGHLYPEADVTANGDFVLVCEGWSKYQHICVARDGEHRSVVSFEHAGARWLQSRMGQMQSIEWSSDDDLAIQGYLCLPSRTNGPVPLILNVHGAPVYTFRNKWQLAYPLLPLLVSRGYAVLNVNPRGSSGRGQEFASKVLGDMGGKDARDLIAGVQATIDMDIADPKRIGVMGVSYGGYLAAWLPTQYPHFAASVPISAITNWYSNHNTSNIGYFDELFFQSSLRTPGGLYHSRSPVMFAGNHKTPVLQIAGQLDRCVHPSQAEEYHKALTEAGVKSALAMYPQEGHGVRQDAAYLDFCTRVIAWFDDHMSPL